MKIKRTLDFSNTRYELEDLSRRQFSELFHCLEKQLYLYLFIKCMDCQTIILNDDDNVCLRCGSKITKRILINNPIFRKAY